MKIIRKTKLKEGVHIVNITQSIRQQRRPKGHISSINTNLIHLRTPWVVAWWSVALPGFGHILLGMYSKGFILIIWEIFINLKAHLNLAILYSFTGQFDLASNVLDKKWVLLYVPMYIAIIWDSYRLTVDLNKFSVLADREKSLVIPFKISNHSINFLDKRNPWVTVVWSALSPGLGQLCTNRIVAGFFLILWWVAIVCFSNFLTAIHYTSIGLFRFAVSAVNAEWLLFIPSIYGFAIWDAYVGVVEQNKLFETEQARFLKNNYQNPGFIMPI